MMLSLSMIVRDEEKYLGSCLESVRGLVDEMVILDTGSIDKTVEIAKSFGARVEYCPWSGDFAPARNEALKLVKGDWVLVLDADERIRSEAIDEIKNLISLENVLLVNLLRYESGALTSPYSLVSRLFRRHPKIEWSRPYHSLIDDSVKTVLIDEPSWQIINCSVPALIHLGYCPDVIKQRSKAKSLKYAMEQCLVERPNDPYASAKLGALEIAEGSLDRGVSLLRNGLNHIGSSLEYVHERYELLLNLAIGLASKDPLAAQKYYEEALNLPLDPRISLGAALNLAALLMKKGDLDKAIKLTIQLTEIAPEVSKCWFNLGLMYRYSGNLISSINSYQKAIELDPLNSDSHKNLAVVHLLIGDINNARKGFRKTISLLECNGALNEIETLKRDLNGIIKFEDSRT